MGMSKSMRNTRADIQAPIKHIGYSIIQIFVKQISMTFQSLEIGILKLHDFSKFFMTVQTLNINPSVHKL